jgi:hypothetical protein
MRTVTGLVIAMMLLVNAVDPTKIPGPVNNPTADPALRPVINVLFCEKELLHPTSMKLPDKDVVMLLPPTPGVELTE